MTQVTLPSRNKEGQPALWTDVESNDQALATVVNGELDNENLKSGAGITRTKLASDAKGVQGTWYTPKVIATEENRTNTAFGKLTTADEITGVVVPENGILVVGYQAIWKSSVSEAGQAAIFIGSNQYKVRNYNAGEPQTMAGVTFGTAFHPLVTQGAAGIVPVKASEAAKPDATTGQGFGHIANGVSSATKVSIGGAASEFILLTGSGPCQMFAAAGTYNISVQFKASSGTVTAKERKLWAYVIGT